MVHSNKIYLKHYQIIMIYGHKKEDSFIPLHNTGGIIK